MESVLVPEHAIEESSLRGCSAKTQKGSADEEDATVDQAVKKAWVVRLVRQKASIPNKCECSTENKASEDIAATKQQETHGDDNICTTQISEGSKQEVGQGPSKRFPRCKARNFKRNYKYGGCIKILRYKDGKLLNSRPKVRGRKVKR